MRFLDKIRKKLTGNNNKAPQECADGHNCDSSAIDEIDDTMIDAEKRIEKMLEEMRG